MKNKQKHFSILKLLTDLSLYGLIGVNISAAVLLEQSDESIIMILWVYWFQSVVIGIVNVLYIRSLKNYSTEGLRIGRRKVEPNEKTKKKIASSFIFSYNFVMFCYGFLIFGFDIHVKFSFVTITGAVLFLIYHLYSFKYNKDAYDPYRRVNIGTVMIFPYLRVIPMNTAILIGAFQASEPDFTTFIWLKIIIDVIMQTFENRKKYFRPKLK